MRTRAVHGGSFSVGREADMLSVVFKSVGSNTSQEALANSHAYAHGRHARTHVRFRSRNIFSFGVRQSLGFPRPLGLSDGAWSRYDVGLGL